MQPSSIATLLVSCPDRKGLVAALAQLLYGHGANILDADQHSDAASNHFFQRIRYDLADLHTDRYALERAIGEVAARFSMSYRIAYGVPKKRLAIFVSRFEHCLYDLILRHRSGELNCDLALIVSNHEDLRAVADQFAIPFHYVPITPETKGAQEAFERQLLEQHAIDVIVLARYMQILSPEFSAAFEGRAINIHHSFLPAFVGQKPYHQAHLRGVKLVGATAHFVTAHLDQGPIIEQDVARVSHRDSVDDLVRKGRELERTVLARAVRWHLEDRVLVFQNKTIVFEG